MADNIINTRLRLKYDTEVNWTSKNPVLLAGEMAISSDKNGLFKVGNGTSPWSQLAYNQIPWTSVTGRPTALKNPSALTMQFNGVTNKTYDGSSAQVLNITPAAIGAAPASHTHNYAGSSSASGPSNSAIKLNTTRKIGNAPFDGSADITLAQIGAATSDHSHSTATTSAAGLMSAADKIKLDRSGSVKSCTLTASGWSSTAPYTQTVGIIGITTADHPLIALDIPDGTTATNETAIMKAYGYLSNAITGSGIITFKCISKKPEVNFSLSVVVL